MQLLNVRYFTLLKQAYKREIKSLADNYITYVDKKAFLATFYLVYNKAILKSNILLSFRVTGLVLLNLEVVLLRLKVKPYTLTLPLLRPAN